MKFDRIVGYAPGGKALTEPIEVVQLTFQSVNLEQRKCSRCGHEIFFAVKVLTVLRQNGPYQNETVETDSRVMFAKWQAMCEGCKLIVEIA